MSQHPTTSTPEHALVAAATLGAAASGALVARLPATALAAAGPDAPAFLHGQLANDVTGLPVGGAARSLHLNHRGHANAEASVLRRGASEFLVVVDDDRGAWVLESLESHVIFDQVTLAARPELALLTLQGAGAAAALPTAPEPGRIVALELAGAEVLAYPRRRSAHGGFDLLVEAERADAVLEALAGAGALAVAPAAIAALRVLGLTPTAAGEGGEGVLPQEAGLEDALSYRKGCYLGQEIMARIEARGNLRRGLARLGLSAVPAPGERDLRHEGRVVGRLGTVAQVAEEDGSTATLALAVVRNDLPEGAELEVGGASARALPADAVARYNRG